MQDAVDSFYKTFILEDRYLYFLEGLKFTLLIAFFSVLLGLFLGMLVSIITDYHKQTGRLKILHGTPLKTQEM